MTDFSGQTVIVTGSSAGIGLRPRFAAGGANIIINYANNAEAPKRLSPIAKKPVGRRSPCRPMCRKKAMANA